MLLMHTGHRVLIPHDMASAPMEDVSATSSNMPHEVVSIPTADVSTTLRQISGNAEEWIERQAVEPAASWGQCKRGLQPMPFEPRLGEWIDSQTFQEGSPSWDKYKKCQRVKAGFTNFTIPK